MFEVQDAYWTVGGDETRVWSSRLAAYVPVDDATYVKWYETSRPGIAATMLDLERMFSVQWPPGTLKTYTAAARYRKASGGVIVTSLSPVAFISEPVARNTIANALEYIKATPGSTVNWKMSDGSFIVLNEAQLDKAVTAIASFVQSCFTKEGEMVAGINGGTITARADIDAAFATLSNVFP